MSKKNYYDRREFLQNLSLGLLAIYGLPGLFNRASGQDKAKYTLDPNFYGDNYTVGHKMRDGEINIKDIASRTSIDNVIVGGGISGLSMAYNLKNSNYVLLEQYNEAGGQARGDIYNGIGYSYGSSYLYELNDNLESILDDLGLKPVLIECSNFYPDEQFQSLSKDVLNKDKEKFIKESGKIWNKLHCDQFNWAHLPPNLKALDEIPFIKCLSGYSDYFINYLDSILRSRLCGGVNNLSALASYIALSSLKSGVYAVAGQNTAIVNALRKKLKDKILTNSFVVSIELDMYGGKLCYVDKEYLIHEINFKKIIVSTIPMVASHIIANLGDIDRKTLKQFKNTSFLVANLFMDSNSNFAYNNFVSDSYEFSNFLNCNFLYGHDKSNVFTVFKPFEIGGVGRRELIVGDKEDLGQKLTTHLGKALGHNFVDAIKEISLARWGHAMPLASINYFKRCENIKNLNTSSLIFNHSSLSSIPSFASACNLSKLLANKVLN